MRKIVIIDADSVVFKKIVENGKLIEKMIEKDEFEEILDKVYDGEKKVVYITRKNGSSANFRGSLSEDCA